MTVGWLKLGFALLLMVAPAAWPLLTLRRSGLSARARVALALALSPVVVGGLVMAFRSLEGSPDQAMWCLLAVSLPVWPFALRAGDLEEIRPRLTGPTALALTLPVAWCCAFWVVVPHFRLFGWHNLMQAEVCYALSRPGLWIEEPEMAGLVCSYSWFANQYWSAVAAVAGLPPTGLVVLNSLVWIVVLGVLGREVAAALGLGRRGAALAVSLMFFGTNVLANLAWVALGESVPFDKKYTPLLCKYIYLDSMVYSFALEAGLLLIFAKSFGFAQAPGPLVVGGLVLGLGLVYPILLPAWLGVVGAWLFLSSMPRPQPQPGASRGERVKIALAATAAAAVCLAFVKAVTVDRTSATVMFSPPRQIAIKAFKIAMAFAPLGLFALFALRTRRRSTWLAFLCGSVAAALYTLFSLGNLEYKFVFAATISLAPLSALGLRLLLRRARRARVAMLYGLPLVFAGLSFFLDLQQHVPTNLEAAPGVVEGSYLLRLSETEPDAGWVRAIREGAPPNAVVVSRGDAVHVAAFVNRSLFFPTGAGATGYSLSPRHNLVDYRGYPREEYERREHLVRTLYDAADPRDRGEALESILALGRPVAIRLRALDRGCRAWLKSNRIGSELFSDGEQSVWLVMPCEARALGSRGFTGPIPSQ